MDTQLVLPGLEPTGPVSDVPVFWNPVQNEGFRIADFGPLVNAGFADNQWATFNQWKRAGRSVKRGEKGTAVVSAASGYQFYLFNVLQTDVAGARSGGRRRFPVPLRY